MEAKMILDWGGPGEEIAQVNISFKVLGYKEIQKNGPVPTLK